MFSPSHCAHLIASSCLEIAAAILAAEMILIIKLIETCFGESYCLCLTIWNNHVDRRNTKPRWLFEMCFEATPPWENYQLLSLIHI